MSRIMADRGGRQQDQLLTEEGQRYYAARLPLAAAHRLAARQSGGGIHSRGGV